MKRITKPNQAGLSNLIATLILIAAAIVGGAFAFAAMRDQSQTIAASTDAQVQGLSVAKAQNNVIASATVKNTGSKPLENITITIYDEDSSADNIMSETNIDLEPGQTASANVGNLNGTYQAGEVYNVHIHAVASDGSSLDESMKVRVE